MNDFLLKYWKTKPLLSIIWLALIFRLIAVIFSRGYGMHDDHFLVIETAQSWLDGASYNNWFKESALGQEPTILNFLYASIHYMLFYLFSLIGIRDPEVKMFFVRLIHAAWSMITVIYGYKITEKLAGENAARKAGLLLALFWMMPFFGVRNLVEIVCIPFMMLGYWYILIARERKHYDLTFFLAGLLFGFAFAIRFQTAIIAGGIGLVLLFRKQFRETILFGAGVLLVLLIFHGLVDYIIWGAPFTEFKVYVTHNINHRMDYNVGPWYTYILLMLGVLIPPVSFMLIYGYLRTWKKYVLFFLPTFLFFAFHSYFPNKQERFILPILPFILILGTIGWETYKNKSLFWLKHKKWIRGSWIFFWLINIILLIIFSTTFSKKARVESMTYLSKYHGIKAILLDDERRTDATMMPFYYLGQWPKVYQVTPAHPLSGLEKQLKLKQAEPSFVLFFGEKDLQARLDSTERVLPGLVYETIIKPSLVDHVLQVMNPVNNNPSIIIYRNTDIFPDKH